MDTVGFNGSEWRAKRDDPGALPGDGWMLSAGRGKRGDRGDRGERGERGAEGSPGRAAPEIIALYADPNLTETSPLSYAASSSGFGQARTAGYGSGISTTGSDVLPAGNIWTVECRFKISAIPSVASAMAGIGNRFNLSVAKTDGRLIGFYRTTNGEHYIGGTTNFGGGSNPVVTDGLERHVRMVAYETMVLLFLDGVLIGTGPLPPLAASSGNTVFNLGCHANITSQTFTGSVEEFAAFSGVALSLENFPVPPNPYTGSEPGLTGLYHCDGNMNAAVRP